jgi:hypothetical protein
VAVRAGRRSEVADEPVRRLELRRYVDFVHLGLLIVPRA